MTSVKYMTSLHYYDNSLTAIYYIFTADSYSEIILKIGQHLVKLFASSTFYMTHSN